MGEGAGILVLERLDDAMARGATILAEIRGYGSSLDAHGISEPHPEGRGAEQAMRRAIDDAGIAPDAIDAVNAHGTGTPKNDPAETLALKRLLGERAHAECPSAATKSMIGHLMSAAGAVEAIAAIACMRRGMLHPTINLESPDPACDLDYVPNLAREYAQRHVLSCSYGFGGHNAAIVLSRWRRGRERCSGQADLRDRREPRDRTRDRGRVREPRRIRRRRLPRVAAEPRSSRAKSAETRSRSTSRTRAVGRSRDRGVRTPRRVGRERRRVRRESSRDDERR